MGYIDTGFEYKCARPSCQVMKQAPRILLPTHSMPTVPVAILERAIIRQFPDLAPPIGVLPEPSLIFSIAEARPIARDVLETWVEVFQG